MGKLGCVSLTSITMQRDEGGKSGLFLIFSPGRTGGLSKPGNLFSQAALRHAEGPPGIRRQSFLRYFNQLQFARFCGADQSILEQNALRLVHAEVYREDFVDAPIGHWIND